MALQEVNGFAEIYPEDKHHIVKMLQSEGHIVGMTGDGANV
jgi:H+-transporting ATPase